jgi:acyl-CoA dehydrogenase
MATGLARSAMEFAIDYVKKRRAFGQKIGDFQSIQFMIAGMYQKVETARLLTWRSAWEADQERDPLLYASMTKLYATEIALEVASDALQCFGGYGYTKMMPIEKLFRDAKLYQIYEGTTQVQKMIIGRAALHEYKPVMPALEDLPREDLRVSIGEDGELDIYERYADETGRTGWRCRICGYIHYGDEPPESCPICLFPGSVFKRVIH